MRERTRCPECGQMKTPYLVNSDYCQKCYRKILDKYSFWKYRDENKMPKSGTTEYKVCEIMIRDNIKPKEVIKKFGKKLGITSVKYVYAISEKYLVRCDTYGNERPDIYRLNSR